MLSEQLTRRRFLQTGVVAAAGLGTSWYVAVHSHEPIVKRIEVSLDRLPTALDGFTIAQLSDFHYDPQFNHRAIELAVEQTNALSPDLIVLTGDYVTVSLHKKIDPQSARDECPPCAELLGKLTAPFGVAAIMGNHDHFSDPDFIALCLKSQNIRVLRNECFPIVKNGSQIWIAGVDDVLGDSARLKQTVEPIPANQPTVLIAHEPDFADYAASFPVDLQLSGHSHGGQIRFPLVGPLYLPDLARKYPWGLRRIGGMKLYTNSGIGTIRVPFRVNCPPEITFFTLHTSNTAHG